MTHTDKEYLKQYFDYCSTPRQKEVIEAVIEHGSNRKAALALGISRNSVDTHVNTLKIKAAREGFAPGHFSDGTAPGYLMGKVTVQRGPGGSIERTWERQSPDLDKSNEAIKATLKSLSENLPKYAPIKAPNKVLSDLCNLYTLTDCHIGMYAWKKQGGKDWNLQIAEETITNVFYDIVDNSPRSETCIIANLGDFLHYDGLLPVTPTSKHILDSDGGFSQMVEVAIRVLRKTINYALKKHQKVILMLGDGNHDMASSIWIRHMFKVVYENEPRIEVVDSELPYYAYQFGKVALFWHHSHIRKLTELPNVMAAQFPKIWGDTEFRFCHTGDKHHTEEKEFNGIICIQHPTLAARDAYSSTHGYNSMNRAMAITYHKEYGEVGRKYCSPEMVSG